MHWKNKNESYYNIFKIIYKLQFILSKYLIIKHCNNIKFDFFLTITSSYLHSFLS